MIIKNIYIYDEYGVRHMGNVLITENDGVTIIPESESSSAILKDHEIREANGGYTLMPGMLDAHVHGQGGPDFADVGMLSEKEGIPVITEALGATGLSYAMATLVSLELPVLEQSLKAINDYVEKENENPTPGLTKIVGVHLEGPFIAKNCKGAHALNALQPEINIEMFKDIIKIAPSIKEWKITLAPDLPGAQQFISDVKELEKDNISVKVFIGHTNPEDKEDVTKAVEAGAAGFTHLGNACGETCCREARQLDKGDAASHVVQWVLEHPEQCPPGVELIVDGVHLSQSFVQLVKNSIGDKIVLVTDALGPSGLEDGTYKLGSLAIIKDGNNFYLADEATGSFLMKQGTLPDGEKGLVKSLSGSAAPLSFCVQKYSEWTAGPEMTPEERMDSIYAATVINPRMSSLSPRAIADLPDQKNFVIYDEKGKLIMSMCNGKMRSHEAKRATETSYLSVHGLHSTQSKRLEGELPSDVSSPENKRGI